MKTKQNSRKENDTIFSQKLFEETEYSIVIRYWIMRQMKAKLISQNREQRKIWK
jgi:hypothetical protein